MRYCVLNSLVKPSLLELYNISKRNWIVIQPGIYQRFCLQQTIYIALCGRWRNHSPIKSLLDDGFHNKWLLWQKAIHAIDFKKSSVKMTTQNLG